MSKKDFFPQRSKANPTIYAYTLPNDTSRKGQLKIGFTTRSAHERIEEQIGATQAKYEIVLIESAIRNDGSSFTDHNIHKYLRKKGFKNIVGEWFRCKVGDVKAAIIAIKERRENIESRTQTFRMRPEQEDAVNKTIQYFESEEKETVLETGDIKEFDEDILPLPPMLFYIYQAPHFAPSLRANLSKNKYLTGHIQTNREPKKSGMIQTGKTLILLFQEWSCSLIKCLMQ